MVLNFALVGCGRISRKHSELLGGDQIPDVKLISVCDTNEERAKYLAAKFNVSFYVDMDEMMQNEDVDVICVLTPSGLHAEHVINLAKYKKHIVVEKPLALTLDDADAMIQACNKNNIKLFVVKQNRFNLPVQKLREALEQNRFGKLFLGTVRVRWCRHQDYYDQDKWRGTWDLDGGILANQAIHYVDLLLWLMGDVESVMAKNSTFGVEIEADDTAVVILKFESGALGVIEATTAVRPKDIEGSISILGTNGSAEIGGFAANELKVWNFVNTREEDKLVIKDSSVNPPNVYGFGHKEYLDHVVDCIQNKKSALVDGLAGRKSLALIDAIYKSIGSGKEVFLNEN